ncbi:MAG: hypothetical protein HOW73_24850 [Polyangiaceae bacterium]|nr:hypothetical protein [Polyangiaceae bacterium]
MTQSRFPIGVWGVVERQEPGASAIERIRIDTTNPAGFVIITKEPKGTFDVWVETEEEVLEFLGTLDVRWEP